MAAIQDDYEILSDAVHRIQDVTYTEIRKLALTSNSGLASAKLRERLDAIADMIRLRDDASDTLQRYVTGNLGIVSAITQLQARLAQLFGTREQYSECPEEDDLDPDPH
jgi:hypothetical protein